MNALSVPVLRSPSGHPLVLYTPAFLDAEAARALEAELTRSRCDFKSGFMLVGDLWVKTPRLVAEYGDDTFVFPDTGPNRGWSPALASLRDRLEGSVSGRYNYALANWYRTGRDFTGWHTDKMDLHRPGSHIAMVSVGVSRRMAFRRTDDRNVVAEIDVECGSLLVMTAGSQRGYEHSIRPDAGVEGHRISVTYRDLLPTTPPVCTCRDQGMGAGTDDDRAAW